MSKAKPGATSAPIESLEQSVDAAISALVAAEYDDGVHPVVVRVIDDLRYALNYHRISAIRRGSDYGDQVLDALALALPYVECAADDPAYDKGVVRQLANRIKALIERVDAE